MLTCVMCYATTVCSTLVVRVGLCAPSFGRGFLPMYDSREVSTHPRRVLGSSALTKFRGGVFSCTYNGLACCASFAMKDFVW